MFEALGVPDNMGGLQVGNHPHCAFPAGTPLEPAVEAFITKFLLGGQSNTSIMCELCV